MDEQTKADLALVNESIEAHKRWINDNLYQAWLRLKAKVEALPASAE